METVIAVFAAFGLRASAETANFVRVEATNNNERFAANEIKRVIEDDTVRPAEIPAVYVIVEEVDPPKQ